jgi:hypothetical protein
VYLAVDCRPDIVAANVALLLPVRLKASTEKDAVMRVDQGDTSIWHGTKDAPAVEGEVPASANGLLSGAKITIAVKPARPRYKLELRYRRDNGPIVKVNAIFARSDNRANTQYYVAILPPFDVGDHVEYVAVASWPNGQIPSETEAKNFRSSFQVVSSEKKARLDSAHVGTRPSVPPLSAPSTPSSAPLSGGVGKSTPGKETISKVQLLSLAKSANLTVLEALKTDPILGGYLSEKIATTRRSAVLRMAKSSSKPFLDALAKIDFSVAPKARFGLLQIIQTGLVELKSDSAIMREAAAKLNALERSGRLIDPAMLELPLRRHPLFQSELSLAALYQLADSAKL